MEKIKDIALAWIISGIFMAGLYTLGHYVLQMTDTAILIMAGWVIWSDMAKYINKPDAKAS